MKRRVGYDWRLRDLMADHGMFTTTELVPLLRDRGVQLSVSQVHRLVTGTPERLSLTVLAALCDIFECSPAELIHTEAANLTRRTGTATGTAGPDSPPTPGAMRPTRARIRPQ
ncbi:MAG TPA: helix-turn-helix transcriptional regulator [Umezawaea sp.]|nr:helix-turn-helix transcriptional regulator [Umezawaea sp.]